MIKCFVLNAIPLSIKMNEIVNKEINLCQKCIWNNAVLLIVLVVYSQKKKERIGKFMQTGNTDFIYKNEVDKACFQHDMTYGKTKDLVKRTQSDKALKDKSFKIASDPKYGGYQRGLASMVYNFFIKSLKEVVLPLHLQINLLMNQIIN